MPDSTQPTIVWNTPAPTSPAVPKIVWSDQPPSQASPIAQPAPPPPGAVQWDDEKGPAPSLWKRFEVGDQQGLLGSTADLLRTVDMAGNKLIGPAPEGSGSPADLAKELDALKVPDLPEAHTMAGGIASEAGQIAGSAPAGVVNWFLGVPFAAAHGWHTAEEQAAAQGKTATTYEKVHDAIVEGLTRGFLGVASGKPWGRIPKALVFAAAGGAESAFENASIHESLTDAAVNGLMGLIVPDLDYKEHARIRAANDAAQRGDVKGSMAHLRPILDAHKDAIAAAARQVDEKLATDNAQLNPPKPTKTPKPATTKPGTDLAVKDQNLVPFDHAAKPPDDTANTVENWDKLTPLEKAVIQKKVGADLAVRITQREYTEAQARTQLSKYETLAHGVPDDERVQDMADFQRGGVDGVRDEMKPVFRAASTMLTNLYHGAQHLGLEYEFRKNYLPGMYRPVEKPGFFDRLFGTAPGSRNPGAGGGKGYFTKNKIFDDYLQAKNAGAVPLTTNPAVLSMFHVEAHSRALARILSMQDLEEAGLARKIGDFTGDGKEWNPNSPLGPSHPDYAGGVTMDVGGKRWLVEPTAAKMFEWAYGLDTANLHKLLGVDSNGHLVRAVGTTGKAWMAMRNATIPMQLSFSGFHALHIQSIDMVQGVSVALTEALNGRLSWSGFLKAFADTSARGSFAYGKHLSEIFDQDYDTLNEKDRVLLNVMIAGGFNPRAPGIYEVRATEMIRRTMNDEIPTIMQQFDAGQINRISMAMGITAESLKANFLGRIGQVAEAVSGPMFSDWIPSVKAAAYMNMAAQILSGRPELLAGTPEANSAMRVALREVTKSIDNRFGMMQMDKLFMPTALKRGLMGTFLSVGWNLGFLREFVWGPGTSEGAIPDTMKMIRDATPGLRKPGVKAELTHRTMYAFSYVFAASTLVGISNYLSTGKGPDGYDYFVYLRLPDGSKLNTMFFTREFAAFYYHLKTQGLLRGSWDWIAAKQVSLVSSLIRALNNKGFYGEQIYDPNAGAPEQIAQGMEHMLISTTVPMSVQAYASGKKQTPSQFALGLAGFTPAPGYAAENGVIGQIREAYGESGLGSPIQYGDIAKHKLLEQTRQLYQEWLKTGDPSEQQAYMAALTQYAKLYPFALGRGNGELKRQMKSWGEPQGAEQFSELGEETQTRLLREWSPQDRATYMRYAHPSVRHMFEQTTPAIQWSK